MIQFRIFVFTLLLALLVVFMMQNVNPVEIRFLMFRQSVPLIGVICVLALTGFIMGYLTAIAAKMKRRK